MTIDYTKLKVEEIQKLIVDAGWMTQVEIYNSGLKGKTQWVDLHKTLSNKESGDYYKDEKLGGDCITTPSVFNENLGILVVDDDENSDYYQKSANDENINQNMCFFFEAPEEEPSNMMEKIEELPKTPGYADVEWQDYVMSQFAPNELVDKKYPSVNGLRRVVELLLGEIVQSGPSDVKTTMDPDSPGKSVITYEISIAWKLGASQWGLNLNEAVDCQIKTFRAVGSSWHGNTDDIFAVFPEAIAETRAEGRALRRALRLGVVCSDELTRKNTADIVKQSLAKSEKATDGNWDGESSLITDNQINSIRILCDRLGVDSVKFINSGSKKYADIVEISRQTAANMIKRLNAYQSSENGSVSIPADILISKN